MKNVKGNEDKNATKVTFNYGTHMKDVVKISDVNISVFDDSFLNDKIVVAKDIDESLYVTVKSYVDSGLLDPFKCYRKNQFTIKEQEPVDNGPTFYIKYKGIEPGVTI